MDQQRSQQTMTTSKWPAVILVVVCATFLAGGAPLVHGAQDEAADARTLAPADAAPRSAPSRVTAVTVYQGNALVTREVNVPAGKGLVEIVVTPLPPQTVDSSLYTEGTDGVRVLSTRYRTRAVKEDTRKEVRAKELQIHDLALEAERLQKEVQVIEQNLQLLTKLENFTGATMQNLAEKGFLNSEATLALAKYVMTSRTEKSAEQIVVQQKLKANAAATEFANRELAELTSGSSRTERDAVIVVDKGEAAGKVRLNYLVTAATWRPQYRFRAGAEKDPVQLEYLAAIEQQSGEDWTGVDMTLSTAQPQLNATPPELLALDIAVVSRAAMSGDPRQPGQQSAPAQQMAGMMGGMGAAMGGGRSFDATRQMFHDQSQELRKKAQEELIGNRAEAGKAFINEAAAIEQAQELLARKDEKEADDGANKPDVAPPATAVHEGPSVTYHLRSRLTVPSRNDQQLIEVARIDTKPDYYYKAVPVLTTHVYRLADLANTSEYVLLPGEATMYVGTDFVGRMNLPLVAIGERYTVGFGVDPQLQVGRVLVKKSRTVQGGNQVHNYEYRITVGSYKSAEVKVQVWDRLPRAEAEAVAVSLVEQSPRLSSNATYLRQDRPENLLRWDLTVAPGQTGEKAANVAYQFKLEYARDVAIANFKTKR
jgi:Domain of unknown function (DUF4139)/N-terminal domain of unknown function (DUF4140)